MIQAVNVSSQYGKNEHPPYTCDDKGCYWEHLVGLVIEPTYKCPQKISFNADIYKIREAEGEFYATPIKGRHNSAVTNSFLSNGFYDVIKNVDHKIAYPWFEEEFDLSGKTPKRDMLERTKFSKTKDETEELLSLVKDHKASFNGFEIADGVNKARFSSEFEKICDGFIKTASATEYVFDPEKTDPAKPDGKYLFEITNCNKGLGRFTSIQCQIVDDKNPVKNPISAGQVMNELGLKKTSQEKLLGQNAQKKKRFFENLFGHTKNSQQGQEQEQGIGME
jgi:hypothetical protein